MSKFLNLVMAIFAMSITSQGEDSSNLEDITTLFREIGFSPSCVAKSLALCENARKSSFISEIPTQKNCLFSTSVKQKASQTLPQNCADLLHHGDTGSGVRTVYPYMCCPNRPVVVFCDQTTDGGGWTVFQRRQALPEREDFFRNWIEYRLGFGDLNGGEFWLGLDNIHALVSDVLMELRADLEDFNSKKRYAKFDYFYIADKSDKYRLELGSYTGSVGDSLTYHSGQQFSTKDQDNDNKSDEDCAQSAKGGWWYNACREVNLNGLPHEANHSSYGDGINWYKFHGPNYSLKSASLSVRPKFYIEK